jgi:hypothetical protein
MQAQGEIRVTQEITHPINYIDEPPSGRGPEIAPSPDAPKTVLLTGDDSKMELVEIEPFQLDQSITDIGDREFTIPGLKRANTMKFTVKM